MKPVFKALFLTFGEIVTWIVCLVFGVLLLIGAMEVFHLIFGVSGEVAQLIVCGILFAGLIVQSFIEKYRKLKAQDDQN